MRVMTMMMWMMIIEGDDGDDNDDDDSDGALYILPSDSNSLFISITNNRSSSVKTYLSLQSL